MPGAQQLWSLTANSNQTADPAVNLREGWAPSQANDSIRMIMAKLKAYMLDTSGALVTGGTSTAYTLATNEGITSLVDGMVVAFRVHTPNGGAATLAVDGLAAKPLHKATQADLVASDLVGAAVYRATYRAGADDFALHEVPAPSGVLPAGTRLLFQQSSAPLGWTKETNGAFNDVALRLVTGAVGSGGSQAFVNCFSAGRTPTGGVTVNGHTLTAGEIPSHRHFTVNGANPGPGLLDSTHPILRAVDLGGSFSYDLRNGTDPADLGLTSPTGGGGSHSHTASFAGAALPMDVLYRDVIIAQKD